MDLSQENRQGLRYLSHNRDWDEVEVTLPYGQDRLLGVIRGAVVVEEESYGKETVVLKLRARPDTVRELSRLLAA